MAFGLSAGAVSLIGGGLGLAAGALGGGSKQSGTQTVTNQSQLDPRISGAIFGDGGTNSGLVNKYTGMLDNKQNAGIANFGAQQDGYLGYNAGQDQNHIRETAYGQMQGNTPSPVMPGTSINAPDQNGMNLSGSYDKFINGDAGANPYLTKAIGGALDQSTNQFRQMQSDATDNLQRNILPGVRSNAVLAGQYGGSRQGVAEGNAISDFTRQQAQAQTQFGQNNTNQAVGAQATAFNQGQDRALSATQGLGAQQYGVAGQNAAFTQGANQTNVGAQLQTNGLNVANQQQGVANLGGLLGQAYNVGQNQDSYALNQAGKVNGLLSPYLSANASSTTSQPLYSNPMGNAIGGAAAGLGLSKQIGNVFGQGGSVPSTSTYANNNWFSE
jgi:hypothetical protein